ncbi:MAG: hypothetical protein JSW53_02915, partial [Candidatus Bathyarchaeota archaeon]
MKEELEERPVTPRTNEGQSLTEASIDPMIQFAINMLNEQQHSARNVLNLVLQSRSEYETTGLFMLLKQE